MHWHYTSGQIRQKTKTNKHSIQTGHVNKVELVHKAALLPPPNVFIWVQPADHYVRRSPCAVQISVHADQNGVHLPIHARGIHPAPYQSKPCLSVVFNGIDVYKKKKSACQSCSPYQISVIHQIATDFTLEFQLKNNRASKVTAANKSCRSI